MEHREAYSSKRGRARSTSDRQCVGYARECVRLAGLSKDTEIRDQLLGMARDWMATAMHEDGRKADPAMDHHPTVLECAARTEQCSRTSSALDKHLAESHSGDMEMLNDSRDTITRSRQLLSNIDARNVK